MEQGSYQDCATCGKAWRCVAACEAKNGECCKVDDELMREREEIITTVYRVNTDLARLHTV